MGRYDDIINLQRPHYDEYPPMPLEDRAAQFSPFAAVVGYGDAVKETSRLTEDMTELSEDGKYEIDMKLMHLSEILSDRPEVEVVYFVPDPRKSGGSYRRKTGIVKRLDSYENAIVFEDKEKIQINLLLSLRFLDEYDGNEG